MLKAQSALANGEGSYRKNHRQQQANEEWINELNINYEYQTEEVVFAHINSLALSLLYSWFSNYESPMNELCSDLNMGEFVFNVVQTSIQSTLRQQQQYRGKFSSHFLEEKKGNNNTHKCDIFKQRKEIFSGGGRKKVFTLFFTFYEHRKMLLSFIGPISTFNWFGWCV